MEWASVDSVGEWLMATEEERALTYRRSIRNRWHNARVEIHVLQGDHAARAALQAQWDPIRFAALERRDYQDPSRDLPSYLFGMDE